jgi:hypothetical protein
MTLLDEHFVFFLIDYLPSPPLSPAVGAMFVAVAVAYIAAERELMLAFLCSLLRVVVEPQHQDANTFNQSTSNPGCCQSPAAVDLKFEHPLCMVGSDAVVAAMPIREGFDDDVANERNADERIPCLHFFY